MVFFQNSLCCVPGGGYAPFSLWGRRSELISFRAVLKSHYIAAFMRLVLNQKASGTSWKMDPVKLNLGLFVMKLKIRSIKILVV